MNLFEEDPRYCGLVVFQDHVSQQLWCNENHPSGWTFNGWQFRHPDGARVWTVEMDHTERIAGLELQKVLFVDEPTEDVEAYIRTRVRSGLTGIETAVENSP